MNDKTLLKLSLICSLCGVVILFLISPMIKTPYRSISEINSLESSDSVKLQGVVTNIKELNNTVMIDVAQLNNITVVVFSSNIQVYRGDYIEVTGTVQDYEGKKGLIADKIIIK
jgi:pyrimidine operon attenuation protein/uracil phosphoribosyltransferase